MRDEQAVGSYVAVAMEQFEVPSALIEELTERLRSPGKSLLLYRHLDRSFLTFRVSPPAHPETMPRRVALSRTLSFFVVFARRRHCRCRLP